VAAYDLCPNPRKYFSFERLNFAHKIRAARSDGIFLKIKREDVEEEEVFARVQLSLDGDFPPSFHLLVFCGPRTGM
jgi:hypothetical protein